MSAPRQQNAPLTDKRAAALAAGRAKRAANLEAAREQQEQAEPAPVAPQASPMPSPTSQPTSPSASAVSTLLSVGSARATSDEQDVDLAALEMIFEDDSPAPADRARAVPPPPARRPAPKPAKGKPATKQQPRPAAQQAAEDFEARVAREAEAAAPSLANLIILASTVMLGEAAAPKSSLAQDMAKPALRIMMRHIPALMTLSPDARDGGELITAVTIWQMEAQKIRRERRQEPGVRRAPIVDAAGAHTGPGVGPTRRGQLIRVPALDSVFDPASARAEHNQDAARAAADPYGTNGHDPDPGSRASLETQSFAELGINL